MLSFIKTLLQASAWPIQAPEPYSAFHILLCAAGIPLAVFLARRLARTGTHPCGVLFICGLVLAVSELPIFYRQPGPVQLVVFSLPAVQRPHVPVSDSSVIQAYAPLPDGKMHLHLHAGFCTFGRRHGPG